MQASEHVIPDTTSVTMCPPSRPSPDQFDNDPRVQQHFSTTPQLTPLAPDHFHAERAQLIQTKLGSLYDKHGLQPSRFYGLYYFGTRAQLTCSNCDRIMLVVLELTHEDIQKWREFDAEVRQVLRDHKPNECTEFCVRYYERPGSARTRPTPPRLHIPPTEGHLNGIPRAPVLQNRVPTWAPGDGISTYRPRSPSPVPDELSRWVERTRFGYYDAPASPVAPPYSPLTPTGPSHLSINPIPSPPPAPRSPSPQPARNPSDAHNNRDIMLRATPLARSVREAHVAVERHVANPPLQNPTLRPVPNGITLEVGTPLIDGTLLTESTPLYHGMQLADGTALLDGMELLDGTVLERYEPSSTEAAERLGLEDLAWARAYICGILRRVPRVVHGMFNSYEVVPQGSRIGL